MLDIMLLIGRGAWRRFGHIDAAQTMHLQKGLKISKSNSEQFRVDDPIGRRG